MGSVLLQPTKTVDAECRHCGVLFKPRHGASFCSRACWFAFRAARSKERNAYPHCSEPGCDRVAKARGLCGACYERASRKGTRPGCRRCGVEVPLRYRYCAACKDAVRVEGTKRAQATRRQITRDRLDKCPRCGVNPAIRSDSEFGRRQLCDECRQRGRKSAHLRHIYGIDIERYEAMLKAQGGRCAICQRTEPGAGNRWFYVDHDHITGQVRGLLCNGCNVALGHFQDDPDIIAKAAKYVRSHRQLRLATQ